MGLFKYDAEGTYNVGTLDIRNLRCNVKIERKGRGNKVSVKITQGTHAEKRTLRATNNRGQLTLSGGVNSPRRIVHMATEPPGGQTRQVLRNTTLEGSMVIGNARDISFGPTGGDARVGSARNVNFSDGLTVHLTVGARVRIIED